ncbi:MAG: hypothetical protein ABI615_02230 [Chthoniobacterales bacterium]
MTLIELIFFIFNAAMGFLLARLTHSHFGLIPAIVAFPIGFMASIGVLKIIVGGLSFIELRSRKKKDDSN